jgi:hypothetical protein
MPNEHASPHATDSTITVFRTVEVSQDVPITLGQPLSPQAMALMESPTPPFILRPGTYANAEEIKVLLGVGAAVQQMDFVYAAGTDYQQMVAEYEVEIGPPTSQQGGPGNHVTVWQDANTVFRLVESNAGVRSMLRDLAPTAEAQK